MPVCNLLQHVEPRWPNLGSNDDIHSFSVFLDPVTKLVRFDILQMLLQFRNVRKLELREVAVTQQ